MEGCGRVSHPLTLGIGRKEVGWFPVVPRLVSSLLLLLLPVLLLELLLELLLVLLLLEEVRFVRTGDGLDTIRLESKGIMMKSNENENE